MIRFNKIMLASVLLLSATMAVGPVAVAADTGDELTRMLHEFLAGAGDADAHERFWAEDLVYTSSRGTRTTKAEIMQGFSAADDNAGNGPVYTAEDIQIRVYGTTAVVAFRLVATPAGGANQSGEDSMVQHYFNTGTFLQRDGIWQVVAWQATKIPGS